MFRQPLPGAFRTDPAWIAPPHPSQQVVEAERGTDLDVVGGAQPYGHGGGVPYGRATAPTVAGTPLVRMWPFT